MNRIEILSSLIKRYYSSEDPAHDWPHVLRVMENARQICQNETAQEDLVLAAVLCHDLVNLPKNHPDRSQASTLAAEEAIQHLINSGFNPQEIELIKKAIVEHSFSRGLKPSMLEAAIVQDADRLDALGAIGILRCASVNTQIKSSFYDFQDPMAENRELDDKRFMLDHYFVKLFKLPKLMNTKTAYKMAEERVSFMRLFIEQLSSEI
jgi:uncharacterized protein